MCEALGRSTPRISLPISPVRWAVSILEDLIGYQPFIDRDTIDKYTEDIAVSSQRIQTELGFKPQYDLRSGWYETVQEMRKMGDL